MTAPCRFFNTPNGCRHGNYCRFLHIVSDVPICRFFNTRNGCLHGRNCYYKHEKQYESQSNEPIQTFKSNESKINSTNAENNEVILYAQKDRKTITEYLIFGECRKYYSIIPYEIANIIIQYYFIKYQYLALFDLFHWENEQINYFGIDPFIHNTKTVKKNIFGDGDGINFSLYALASLNDPFFTNLFPIANNVKHANNDILIRIQDYETFRDRKDDNIGNYVYCIETEEIINLPPMTHKKSKQQIICTPKHGLFVIGGYSEDIHRLIFDSNNNKMQWKECQSMNVRRADHRAIVMHDKIVIHGGHNGCYKYESSMEMFDIENGTMVNLPSSNVGRAFHGMCYDKYLKSIFIVGGETNVEHKSVTLNSVEMYDVQKDVWTQMPNTNGDYGITNGMLNQAFLDMRDNVLYVMTQSRETIIVEMLDIRTKNWMYYPSGNTGLELFHVHKDHRFEKIFKLYH